MSHLQSPLKTASQLAEPLIEPYGGDLVDLLAPADQLPALKERASRLVREAEEKHRQTLGSLEQERSLLERKIDELRIFERDYRNRMKSYLESQLRDLETRSSGGAGATNGRPASPAQDVGYAFGGGAS